MATPPRLLAVLIGLFLLVGGGLPTHARDAGSAEILSRCWSADELLARPEERLPRRMKKAVQVPATGAEVLERLTHSPLPPALRGSIRQVKPRGGEKLVALGFDLCEAPGEVSGYDGAIIDYLRRQGVKATFFAGGQWMQSHPERTQQLMADPLFEIGNHGWSHANLRTSSADQVRDEILRPQAEYRRLRHSLAQRCGLSGAQLAAIPEVPATFRFPYGTCNAEALDTLAKLGLPAVQWSIVTGDPDPNQGARAIAAGVLKRIEPGAILVAHANGRGRHTAEALTLLIPRLREKGYRFVTLSELLESGEAVAAEECYEMRPGDNRRYDRSGEKPAKASRSNATRRDPPQGASQTIEDKLF